MTTGLQTRDWTPDDLPYSIILHGDCVAGYAGAVSDSADVLVRADENAVERRAFSSCQLDTVLDGVWDKSAEDTR